MRATVPGLAARRSCRAQAARISSFHGMSGFVRCCELPVPHMATIGSEGFLAVESSVRSASGSA